MVTASWNRMLSAPAEHNSQCQQKFSATQSGLTNYAVELQSMIGLNAVGSRCQLAGAAAVTTSTHQAAQSTAFSLVSTITPRHRLLGLSALLEHRPMLGFSLGMHVTTHVLSGYYKASPGVLSQHSTAQLCPIKGLSPRNLYGAISDRYRGVA